MQADRLSAGQHPHSHPHHQQQSVDPSARSVTTIMFPPVSEHVQSSTASAVTAPSVSRDRSSAFLLTTSVLLVLICCSSCHSCLWLKAHYRFLYENALYKFTIYLLTYLKMQLFVGNPPRCNLYFDFVVFSTVIAV